MDVVRIPYFKIEQPIGSIYVGKLSHEKLIKLCSKDLENIILESPYDIYQRKLDERRIPALKMYMKYSNATFPNGIILSANIPLSFRDGYIEVDEDNDAFFIIDGQHRIEALKYYDGNKPFEVCVIIFEGIDKDTRTEIFTTVNSEQKKVNPSIKLNLKGNDAVDTPEKVVRKIAIALNDSKDSPFKGRINFSDESTKRVELKISLAAFMKPIVSNIYNMEKSFQLKDCLYRNHNNRLSFEEESISFSNKALWKFYINSEDEVLYLMLLNYFTAISDVLKKDWNDKDSLLSKTSGYNALILLFMDIVKQSSHDMSYEYLFKFLKPLSIMEGHFYLEEIGVGNSASMRLYKRFLTILFDSEEENINLFDFIEE